MTVQEVYEKFGYLVMVRVNGIPPVIGEVVPREAIESALLPQDASVVVSGFATIEEFKEQRRCYGFDPDDLDVDFEGHTPVFYKVIAE